MRTWVWIAVLMVIGGPAHACYKSSKLELSDIQYADAVVIGHIANYRLVRDPVARKQRAAFLADPKISPEHRKGLEAQDGFLTDYAQFDVAVDRVLFGKSSTVLTVTWHNLTFGEPDSLPVGPYVIAIRDPRRELPDTETREYDLVPSPDPNRPVVLQAICSEPFMFKVESEEAAAVRTMLGAHAN